MFARTEFINNTKFFFIFYVIITYFRRVFKKYELLYRLIQVFLRMTRHSFCYDMKKRQMSIHLSSFSLKIWSILSARCVFQNVFCSIAVAVRANSMRKFWLMTLWTNRKSRGRFLHVRRSSAVPLRFGRSPFRNCHCLYLLPFKFMLINNFRQH